jgi:hypothetical protein
MNTNNAQRIIEETGGDCYYADLFIEAAVNAAASMGVKVDIRYWDFFFDEVERHRKRRRKRINE